MFNKNRKQQGSSKRPAVSLVLFAVLIAALSLYQVVFAAVVSKTNTTDLEVDSELTTVSVNFTAGDFPANAVVHDVDAQVSFVKASSNDCLNPNQGNNPYHSEIVYFLNSPANTSVVLVENSSGWGGSASDTTYTGTQDIPPVTVGFDDDATVAVGSTNNGNPESGIFQPVEMLVAFYNEDPVGDWALSVGDDAAGDPLCHDEFTVSIIPAVEDTQAVAGPGLLTFNNGAEIEVVDDGGCLTAVTVRRVYIDHPDALGTMAPDDYFILTPSGCTSGFTVNLTLPHFEEPDAGDQVCRHTGTMPASWDCAADSFDTADDTITRNGITAPSIWTTANDAGPTAVSLRSSTAGAGATPLILLLTVMLLGLFTLWRFMAGRNS